jgi:hypothetical protein
MPDRLPIDVEIASGDETACPVALRASGCRYTVVSTVRQWDQGRWRYLDVTLDHGKSALLCVDRRTKKWYQIDIRGPSKPA